MDKDQYLTMHEDAVPMARVLAACVIKAGSDVIDVDPSGGAYGFHVVVTPEELEQLSGAELPRVRCWRDGERNLHVEARWENE